MKTYLVGGAVRDKLLGRPVTEKDWVVTGATAATMLKLGYTQVGKDFPVFLHPITKDEHALARLERKTGTGYTGFECDAGPAVTLEEDLLRRDLTINAMAQDDQGRIIDPYHGQQDLEARLLRHVSEAFGEDPLRIFRVARFAARYHYLGFSIASETMALMQHMAQRGMLKELTAERVWQETRRALMEPHAPVFFNVLQEVGGLQDWFTELTLSDSKIADQAIAEQRETLQHACDEHSSVEVRFACLTPHLTVAQCQHLCTRLKCPNPVTDLAVMSAGYATSLLQIDGASPLLTVFDKCDVWRRPERFYQLLEVVAYSAQTAHQTWPHEAILQALQHAQAVDVQQVIAAGHRGPQIRTALRAAREQEIARIFH